MRVELSTPQWEHGLSWRKKTAASAAAFILPIVMMPATEQPLHITQQTTASAASEFNDVSDIYAAKQAASLNSLISGDVVKTHPATLPRSIAEVATKECFAINPKRLHHTMPEYYDNIQLACEMAKSEPWAKTNFTAQMNALVYDLWDPESGWNPRADNPSSSAHGIPQALPGSKMGPGWQSDAKAQIKWGLRYIRKLYGNPIHAVEVRSTRGWY
jgi:hypothetical protein